MPCCGIVVIVIVINNNWSRILCLSLMYKVVVRSYVLELRVRCDLPALCRFSRSTVDKWRTLGCCRY